MNINRILSSSTLFFLLSSHAIGQTLHGRVMLDESTPAHYATVYIPSLGIGTITDTEGQYQLDNLPSKDVTIEYSFIGYSTHIAHTDTLIMGDSLKSILLNEQPVALNEVFVTPNGEDPATYIFRRIHERAKQNRPLVQYDASISSSFLTQDLDIIPMVVPKVVLWMLKSLVRMTSVSRLFSISIEHQKIQAKANILCHSQKGKCKYHDWRLIETTLKDDDFEKAFRKESSIDPFMFAYEPFMNAKELPEGYILKGTIEEDGRTVDVLYKGRQNIINDKVYGDTTFLYVVEDDWGILRKEERSAGGFTRMECRHIGDGIWLPISYIDDPTIIDLNQMIKDAVVEYENDPDPKKASKMERKVFNRLKEIANGKRQFHPCVTMCFNINYK